MLHEDRLADILSASAFQCHKTVDYDNDEEEARAGEKPQQCAGLMTILHRAGQPNQIMQVGQRFGDFKPSELDPDGAAYSSIASAIAAHLSGVEE